ncbi:MAG: hypothetical protein JSS83_00280 [Cyanobacteria bacterium SZAS LIN-3]|nr:hypothetical protein [Cyanobacteria bacterium SZAS LIN-3]
MSSEKQVSYDSNFAFEQNAAGGAASRSLSSEAMDEFKKVLVKREKLIVSQGDFIGEAVQQFSNLDSINKDGKLDRDELVKAAASDDKKTAKLATILLNNTELIAADGKEITLKDLANLQTQKAGLLQERKIVTGISGASLDNTYNAANTNKADDLTVAELTARMQTKKLSPDERAKVGYILSNFEIIDKATGNDGALSEQDIRTYAAGRSARIIDVEGLDNKFDSQSRKVWYETKVVRIPSRPSAGGHAWASDAAEAGLGGAAAMSDGSGMVQGAAGMAAEGGARATGPSTQPSRHRSHHH